MLLPVGYLLLHVDGCVPSPHICSVDEGFVDPSLLVLLLASEVVDWRAAVLPVVLVEAVDTTDPRVAAFAIVEVVRVSVVS